ncbi:MAG: pyridoxamine 5'-phosphate oxidase [Alteromonadaceae bacterium]|nr:MAG: pyridoxamine 5'-phosphate oxidase [Alteromonadaceae bacterium]
MSEKFPHLNERHFEFIQKQPLFFVATAGETGFVNTSPKGMDSLRVINKNKVVWLNLTGSGNETATHVAENGRMTLMFCSFDKQPLILRLYGNANVTHAHDDKWNDLAGMFPSYTGARQIFELDITLVQDSCGFAVPFLEFKGERETLTNWADKRGRESVKSYWEEKNTLSINNKDTGIKNRRP